MPGTCGSTSSWRPTPRQADGLVEGGADLLVVETIFDTLNAKAAIFAIDELFERLGFRLPLMISGTITDASGRTLSGQTPEAFWHSIRHARPFSVGLNCALGARALRPHLQELARVADVPVSVYPNAGLPNEFGGYDETAAGDLVGRCSEFAADGLVNIVGGCCGTTPAHVRAIAAAVHGLDAARGPGSRPTGPACPGSSRWSSRSRATSSSTSASGRTSPARARSPRSSSTGGSTTRSRSPGARSTTAPSSST